MGLALIVGHLTVYLYSEPEMTAINAIKTTFSFVFSPGALGLIAGFLKDWEAIVFSK